MPTYNPNIPNMAGFSPSDLQQIAWNGPPSGIIASGQAQAGLLGAMPSPIMDVPKSARYPVLSKFQQATRDLSAFASEYEGEDRASVAYYFSSIPLDAVIEHIGWWNPVLNGRPKEWAQRLLEGIPSPVTYKAYKWRRVGLAYYTPPMVRRRKSQSRTTMIGLELLKHWHDKFPKFRPFFNAYYSKEGEREITLDCVDFSLGLLPVRFKKIIDRNFSREYEIKEAQYKAATQRMREQAEYQRQMMQHDRHYSIKSMMEADKQEMLAPKLTATEIMEMQNAKAMHYQKLMEMQQALNTQTKINPRAVEGLLAKLGIKDVF